MRAAGGVVYLYSGHKQVPLATADCSRCCNTLSDCSLVAINDFTGEGTFNPLYRVCGTVRVTLGD